MDPESLPTRSFEEVRWYSLLRYWKRLDPSRVVGRVIRRPIVPRLCAPVGGGKALHYQQINTLARCWCPGEGHTFRGSADTWVNPGDAGWLASRHIFPPPVPQVKACIGAPAAGLASEDIVLLEHRRMTRRHWVRERAAVIQGE